MDSLVVASIPLRPAHGAWLESPAADSVGLPDAVLRVGDEVDFQEEMLSATLGPGILGQIYDGLQNPLPQLAEKAGYFLKPGISVAPLDTQRKWEWVPKAAPGEIVFAGDPLGKVPESIFEHPIMVPFSLSGEFKVESVAKGGHIIRYELS